MLDTKCGQGVFTRFLDKVEKLARQRGHYVHVESILNERLKLFLRRRGYELTSEGQSLFLRPVRKVTHARKVVEPKRNLETPKSTTRSKARGKSALQVDVRS